MGGRDKRGERWLGGAGGGGQQPAVWVAAGISAGAGARLLAL